MRLFNTDFLEAIKEPSAELRYTIEITFDDAGTNFLFITSHEDSGFPIGADVVQNAISKISNISQRLNTRNARSEIGSLTFEVGDYNGETRGELHAKLATLDKSPHRKKVVIYIGVKGLDWVNYEPLDTYFIDNFFNTGSGWRFSARDIQKALRTDIFVPDETTLASSISATDMLIPSTHRS
jgi:hypothetical protein